MTPTYANFVRTMVLHIENLVLTPVEVRQACMFACYLVEERKPREYYMTPEEAKKFFGG